MGAVMFDAGELAYVTLSKGRIVTVWNTNPKFAPGQWYRAAPQLDTDNSPGATIVIGDSGTSAGRSGEALWIDNNGHVNVAMTVKNVGKETAAVGFNWASAPGHTFGSAAGPFADVTLSEGVIGTVWTSTWKFAPGEWSRAAASLDTDNSPGTTIVIGDSRTAAGRSGEALWIDNNGNAYVALTVKNVGKGTAAVGFNVAFTGVPDVAWRGDVGPFAYVTLSEGRIVTVWNTTPFENPWKRVAPWLDTDNSPGTSIVIGDSGTAAGRSGEAVWIDNNGNANLAMTVKNVGKGTAAVGFNWCTP